MVLLKPYWHKKSSHGWTDHTAAYGLLWWRCVISKSLRMRRLVCAFVVRKTPQDSFLTSRPILCFLNIQYSSAHVLNSEHTNSGQTCFTFDDENSFSWFQLVEHAYSNLNYLCNINEIGYPLRHLSSAHKTIQQIIYTQCQTNTMDTWTQIQSISRYSRRGVRGTIDLSII